MVQIRIPSDLGTRLPGRPPAVNVPSLSQTAQAVGELGRVGVGLAVDMRAQETRQAQQELEQAERVKAYVATTDGEVELKRLADELGERILSGQLSARDADTEWSSRTADLRNERTKDMPSGLKERVGAMLHTTAGRILATDIEKAKRGRVRAEARVGLMQAIEAAERNALSDRPQATEHVQTMLEQVGTAAGLGPEDQFRELQRFKERTSYNQARRLMTLARDRIADLDDLAGRLQGEGFADLTPENRAALETQIANRKATVLHAQEVAARRAEAAAERRLREAEHATKALQGVIDGGAMPDQAFLEDVQRRAAGTPYSATIGTLVRQGVERAGFASLAPDRQREQILALRSQANAQGSNPANEQRLRQFEEINARQAKLAADDPLRWGVGTRLLDNLPPLQFGDVATLAGSLGDRIEAARTVSAGLNGRAVSPLLASEAQRLAELLDVLPVAQRAGAVRMLSAALPVDQQRALAAQTKDKSGALALAMFAATQPSSVDLPALILRGEDAVKSGRLKKSGDDGVATADRLKIARELDKVSWPTTQAREAAIDAAGLVYDGLRDQKGGSANWREAVKLSSGGLAPWADRMVPVPPGWDERRFKVAMRNTDAVSLAGQMLGPIYVNGREVRAEDLAKAWDTVTLVPVGPGRYAVDAGGLITTAQRRPWVFTLRD